MCTTARKFKLYARKAREIITDSFIYLRVVAMGPLRLIQVHLFYDPSQNPEKNGQEKWFAVFCQTYFTPSFPEHRHPCKIIV
jgi:hypothetical protein